MRLKGLDTLPLDSVLQLNLMRTDCIVIIPTVNEAENLKILLPELLRIGVDILIVDDASTDETVEVAKSFDKTRSQISIISRPEKLGLGSAYLMAYKQILAMNDSYDFVIQMDADGSHSTSDLISMTNEIRKNSSIDLLIGSRWIAGGKVVNWPKRREILSRIANSYSRLMLTTHIKDLTSGFRIYKSNFLDQIDLSKIHSEGYSFQIEMTRLSANSQGVIAEFPIVFTERIHGQSKMSTKIVFEAIRKVTTWGIINYCKIFLQVITQRRQKSLGN